MFNCLLHKPATRSGASNQGIGAIPATSVKKMSLLIIVMMSFATPAKSIQDCSSCALYKQECTDSDYAGYAASEDSCPPGLFCSDGYCECGPRDVYPHFFSCKNMRSQLVLSRHCATFDPSSNTTLTGSCLYMESIPMTLPNDSNLLNIVMCERPFNRTGILCGRCLPGHYPLAYSFNMTCIPCPHTHINWLQYIMAAYLPLTFFYLLILFFKINTTSSHLFAVGYYCQITTTPVFLQTILTYFAKNDASLLLFSQIVNTFCGVWNLDFFRPFYSSICLKTGSLSTIALDYGIAVYPLFLMIVSYLLIKLHDRNCRIVSIWVRPLRKLFSLVKQKWDIRTSVIDAFATFFFLSTTKLLSVSCSLLAPVRVYQLHRNHSVYTWGLYHDPNTKYFGKEHLPYAILAIAVMCIGFILPVTTLALYPFRCFQRFLALFPLRWIMLRTFMDSFHGCYKNGTEPSTRDYRWFVATFFWARFFLILGFYFTENSTYFCFSTIVMILHTTLFQTLRPLKSMIPHTTMVMFMLVLTLLFAITSALGSPLSKFDNHLFQITCLLLSLVPLLYNSAIVLYWVYSHKKFGASFMKRLKARRRGYIQHCSEADALPDRIKNSAHYPKENLSRFAPPTCRK